MINIVELPNRVSEQNQVRESYRTYQLVSTQEKETCVGEVFKQDVRVAYCESQDMNSAQQHLRRIVDWHIKDAIALRSNALPPLDLWEKTIVHVLSEASEQEKILLDKLSKTYDDFVELSELANLAKIASTAEVHFILSNFARKACDFIPYEPPCPGDGRDAYLALMCENSYEGNSVRLSPVFSTILENYRA